MEVRIEMQHLKQDKLSTINEYITEYIDKNGISPTLDEITAGTGIPKTTVQRYVTHMSPGVPVDTVPVDT